ncbi:hypothetical protein C8R43DRAFT_995809 [Mycena crocata]|nr:hypothetical protein C8R43DRAFT_995809 [Mycena crocata]
MCLEFYLARRTAIYIVLTIPTGYADAPVTASASSGFFLIGRASKVRCTAILPCLREIDTYSICHAAASRLGSDTAHCSRSSVFASGGFFLKKSLKIPHTVISLRSREVNTYSN